MAKGWVRMVSGASPIAFPIEVDGDVTVAANVIVIRAGELKRSNKVAGFVGVEIEAIVPHKENLTSTEEVARFLAKGE